MTRRSAATPHPTEGNHQAATSPLLLLGEGNEAQTLALNRDRVLRLLKDPSHVDRLLRERVALAAAREAGLPVPRDYGLHTVDGRPGLEQERIDGPNLLALLERRPWLLARVARTLGETHARLHSTVISHGLPTVHERIRQAVADLVIPSRFRGPALKRLERLTGGNALCHWDFQPTNVILADAGPTVIDWSFAARGDPAADVARTRLILAIGAPPKNAGLIIGRLDTLGRRALNFLYLRSYARARPIDPKLVNLWLPLVALPRLAANIAEERDHLIALIDKAIID
jgi:aminoglycoside phosphotransferase (APT) family kinase protein